MDDVQKSQESFDNAEKTEAHGIPKDFIAEENFGYVTKIACANVGGHQVYYSVHLRIAVKVVG